MIYCLYVIAALILLYPAFLVLGLIFEIAIQGFLTGRHLIWTLQEKFSGEGK